jgi:ATP-dependent protease Clp ATPase subunit
LLAIGFVENPSTRVSCFVQFELQMKLHCTDGALRKIAQKAMVKNTGARGLRSIMENLLTEAMYQVCDSFSLISYDGAVCEAEQFLHVG